MKPDGGKMKPSKEPWNPDPKNRISPPHPRWHVLAPLTSEFNLAHMPADQRLGLQFNVESIVLRVRKRDLDALRHTLGEVLWRPLGEN